MRLNKQNKRLWKPLVLMGLMLVLVGLARADVIKLKSGAELRGAILKQDQTAVIVDLGFDLVRIPRTEIAGIEKDKQDRDKQQSPVKKTGPEGSGTLYSSAGTIEVSTVEGVKTFAPAVVVVRSPGGLGSGFLVNNAGYLVTNFHVIQGQKHITVTRFKKTGKEFKRVTHKKVRIVALDPFHDLAVLRVEEPLDGSFLPPALSTGKEPAVGEKIFVIGNPLGLERTVTEGVISHAGRNFGGKLYLQVDASVNPGNSGGPLFNTRGQVIGVISMGIRSMQGLNFAIPVYHVKFILDHLDAFAYDETNPMSGYVYTPPPPNPSKKKTNIPDKEER